MRTGPKVVGACLAMWLLFIAICLAAGKIFEWLR